MFELNVDTNEVIKFTNSLEKLNRSAFPNAVRNALNSAAFDVKKRTLQISADRNFTKRQPNFFKANSRVFMATGFDIERMEAIIGMIDLGGTNYAVDDLEQQEFGGKIGGKSFIPLDPSRTGKSYSRLVQKKNRLSGIRNVISTRNSSGSNSRQRFIKAAAFAKVNSYILSDRGILFRKNSEKRIRGRFDLTALYSYKSNRSITVKATHFMKEAAEQSGQRLPKFYMVAANREFKKVFK